MMNDVMTLDNKARDRIKEDIFENFFVEAGAGSGKTTNLVTRMVNMVKKGIPVEKICAITYTKAAANEFYERFEEALSDEKDELCRKALKDIDLAFMGTIDSFCNMVISEHPSFVGVPSSVTNRSKEEMALIYKREFSKIRAGSYGERLAKLCSRYIDFNFHAEENFVNILNTLMDKRNNDFIFDKVTDKEISDVLTKDLARTFEVLKKVRKDGVYHGNNEDARKSMDAFLKKSDIMNGPLPPRNVTAVMSFLKAIKDLHLDKETVLASFGPYASRLFKEKISRNKLAYYEFDEEEFVYNKLAAINFSITMEFIAEAIPAVAERLKEKGDLVFFDYILYLRDALKEDAAKGGALIRHIYDRHSYFLIDEFQDTNPIQIEIFFYLSAIEPKEDFRKCIPHKGSLFIVGDPKQSIYRFSGADVSSYMRIRELFSNKEIGEVLILSQNFRSTTVLKKWFNNAFPEILNNDDPDQAAYSEIPYEEKEEEGFTGVYKYRSYGHDKKISESDEMSDPNMVKDIILKMMNDDFMIIDRKGNVRNLEYRDFMLISPHKTHLSSYMKVLRENDIPFRIEGKALFDDCNAFILICRVYGALAYPKDNIKVYEALSSAYFRMSDSDIYEAFTKGKNSFDLTQESDCKEIKELQEMLEKAKAMTASGLYEYIMDRCEVFRSADTLNMEYVYYGLELLKDKEMNNEISGIREAADYLESLLNSEADIERCMSLSRDEDKVHLANAHKVKGLEAPVVIMIDGKAKASSPSLRVERDNKSCYIFDIKKNGLFPVLGSVGYEDKKQKEKAAEDAERDRLLYVAATRARNILIVNDTLTPSGKTASSAWSKAVCYIKDDICDLLKDKKACLPVKETVQVEYLDESELLSKDVSLYESYSIARPSKEVENRFHEDHIISGKQDAALIGTLAHRLMEVLVLSGNKIGLDEAVKGIIDEYCEDDTYKDLLLKLGTAVRNGGFKQEGEISQDILNELLSAEEVYCEAPFSYMDGNELWNGVIDVLYKKDGKWYIVDYKTNADPSDLDEKYKAQLEAYRKAFKESTGLDAKALIYHLGV